ncbi:MSF1-domain-containing protein, partial [Gonapodya prolifera JEL478]
MKFFTTTNSYDQPWAQVTAAHWQKYPNDISKHVIAVDTISRTVDPVTGVLRTERLLTSQQPIPALVRRIFSAFSSSSSDSSSPHSSDVAYALEVSEVDPRTQQCTCYSVNLTFCNIMRVRERLRFATDDVNLGSTIFEQSAEVTATGALKRFAGYVEDFSISRFASNAALGRQGLQQVLDRL